MDYGFAFLSTLDIQKEVALAERSVFYPCPVVRLADGLTDVFQCLALYANKTRRIKLCTSVTNPLSRIAPVAPCNFGSLQPTCPRTADYGYRRRQHRTPYTGDAVGEARRPAHPRGRLSGPA